MLQIDFHRLRTYLLESDEKVEKFTARRDVDHLSPLVDYSFAELLKLATLQNAKASWKFWNALFLSTFLREHNELFASDNSIETARLVMIEAVKVGPTFGSFLRGG